MDESAKISESTADENEEEGELDPRVQVCSSYFVYRLNRCKRVV